jgi:Zn-dependent M28 family amino/carboxypeptidase
MAASGCRYRRIRYVVILLGLLGSNPGLAETMKMDICQTAQHLRDHVQMLTETIGERSVSVPTNLKKTEAYIESFYRALGVSVHTEPYSYKDLSVGNVVAEMTFGINPRKHFTLGAHYDSVSGTVGADDNASAVAVQLEIARQLHLLNKQENKSADINCSITFVSFALEEPPVYGTRYMGSRVYARKARQENKKIDGMICLEMVGYRCDTPGCQDYPFPLMFLNYPNKGDFIGIVGNLRSRSFTASLLKAFQKNQDLPVIKLTVPFSGWIMPSVRLSDHASFWDQGYKAVMITDSAFYRNPHYHFPSDTMETLDYRFMAELAESLVIFFSSQ